MRVPGVPVGTASQVDLDSPHEDANNESVDSYANTYSSADTASDSIWDTDMDTTVLSF